jgi:Xaa-Pro aminopeptidase
MNYQRRRARLLDSFPALTVDALLVTRLTNIRYLTGFTGTTAFLLVAEEPTIVVDFRYREQVSTEVNDVPVVEVASARELWPAVLRLINERGFPRLGIEARTLPTAPYLDLVSANGRTVVPTENAVERLRYRKDEEELDAIRRAIEITDQAFDGVLALIKPGMSEHEVAGEIERLQRAKGGERSASEIIVASGPRSAMPHGIASERLIGRDEPVMFDLGTVVDGYLADLTRTIHIGGASDEFRRIYRIVLDAQATR